MRTPTEKQTEILRCLGSGAAGLSWTKRRAEAFLKHGWVTAELPEDGGYYQWVRITPEGLRALAEGQERYGLPEIGPKPRKWESYCGKCGSLRIYSRSVELHPITAEVVDRD